MSKTKLTKRDSQILAAIEEIGRVCTPHEIRRQLRPIGLDLDPANIKRSCRKMAAANLLLYWPGDQETLVLFGLPGWEVPAWVDRTVDRPGALGLRRLPRGM